MVWTVEIRNRFQTSKKLVVNYVKKSTSQLKGLKIKKGANSNIKEVKRNSGKKKNQKV